MEGSKWKDVGYDANHDGKHKGHSVVRTYVSTDTISFRAVRPTSTRGMILVRSTCPRIGESKSTRTLLVSSTSKVYAIRGERSQGTTIQTFQTLSLVCKQRLVIMRGRPCSGTAKRTLGLVLERHG